MFQSAGSAAEVASKKLRSDGDDERGNECLRILQRGQVHLTSGRGEEERASVAMTNVRMESRHLRLSSPSDPTTIPQRKAPRMGSLSSA